MNLEHLFNVRILQKILKTVTKPSGFLSSLPSATEKKYRKPDILVAFPVIEENTSF